MAGIIEPTGRWRDPRGAPRSNLRSHGNGQDAFRNQFMRWVPAPRVKDPLYWERGSCPGYHDEDDDAPDGDE